MTNHPLTSPAWQPDDGHERCPTRIGADHLQCVFRAGHPPHGCTGVWSNPGTPNPSHRPDGKPMRGWHLMTYTAANGTRWGIGPVGDGTWRHTLGISIVLAGHGYALYHGPKTRR